MVLSDLKNGLEGTENQTLKVDPVASVLVATENQTAKMDIAACGLVGTENKTTKIDTVACGLVQGWANVLFKRMQCSCVLLSYFQKNATFSCSFAFFIKRMMRSLHSFTFFRKESCVLCVLLRSL